MKQNGKKSKSKIEAVWKEYVQSRSEELRAVLIEHYAGTRLIRTIALSVCKNTPHHLWKIEDLCSEGIFGLMSALEKFEPELGNRFETFASYRIRGAMIDFLRREDPVPRLVRQKQKQARLLEEAGESTEQAEERAGLSVQERQMLSRNVRSLDRQLQGGNALRPATLHDKLSNGTENEGALQARRSAQFERLTRGLLFEEKMILWMYYHRSMTMRDIGKFFSLSESRMSQLHSRLMGWLNQHRQAAEHFSEAESA